MRRWGVETDDGRYGPCVAFTVHAENLLTAWVRAAWYAPHDRRVMIVFALDGAYEEATRLDYSTLTGSGDPH